MNLPPQYAALAREPGPKMLIEGLSMYGLQEVKGRGMNPKIVAWADEVAAAVSTPYTRWAADFYNDDSIAWCALWMAVLTVRAGRTPPEKYLSAREWLKHGVAVKEAMLGDILVFSRDGGAHVAIYVGEDDNYYHILGGNQSDAVNIMRKRKSDCIGIRRPAYKQTPFNIRKIRYGAVGTISTNEA